jgi:riboflavin synthase
VFTGIIQSTGAIRLSTPPGAADNGARLRIDAQGPDCSAVTINGCGPTVVAKSGSELSFDASTEALRRTSGPAVDGRVTLEQALRFGDRLGGHAVMGHVDGIRTVVVFHPEGESHRLEIEAPTELAQFTAAKARSPSTG